MDGVSALLASAPDERNDGRTNVVGTAGRRPPIYTIMGQGINVADIAETVSEILRLLKTGSSFFICTLNLDHLTKLRVDQRFRDVYARASVVTADGFPIVLLAWIDRVWLRRTTGADLVEPLCAAAAENGVPIYLLGPTDEALVACIARLQERSPTLQVYGYTAAPYGFDPIGVDATAILNDIHAKGARLCFVGLGAPKQEMFCAWAAERTPATGFIPVGAALEFIAGVKRRAPRWMQNTGLEWLWRLSHEPGRLGRRYMASGALLLQLIFRR